jgi:uncharacterized protein with HEPN domain
MAKLGSVIIQMRHQIDAIQRWIANRTFDDFSGDMMLRNAIERSLEIISEASRRIPDTEKAKHSDIPWRDIADIGNYLRHQYHDLNVKILWDVTQDGYLDQLRAAIDAMNPDVQALRRQPPAATD